jgi:5-methylcytosine-specific restriction endonuclease McrA
MAKRAHRPKIAKRIRLAVYTRDSWTCQYCGRAFEPTDGRTAPHERDFSPKPPLYYNDVWLELDHLHPRHHGGSDDIDNLRAACTPCNNGKSFKILEVTR